MYLSADLTVGDLFEFLFVTLYGKSFFCVRFSHKRVIYKRDTDNKLVSLC